MLDFGTRVVLAGGQIAVHSPPSADGISGSSMPSAATARLRLSTTDNPSMARDERSCHSTDTTRGQSSTTPM